MGKEANYPNFLAFFQKEIEKDGGDVGRVLNEYLFKGDDVAESMFSRLFGGMSCLFFPVDGCLFDWIADRC